MILRFHKPAYPLNEYIHSFTFYEARTVAHNIERLLPDGSVNIIIDLTTEPKHIFDNDTLHPKQQCSRSWVSGMHSQYISIGAAKNACMLVVRFLAGKSYPFLKLPLFELNNTVTDADALFGNRINALREQLGDTPSVEQKFVVMEAWLNAIANLNETDSMVSFAVNELNNNPGSFPLKLLASKSGYSQKQFISIFKKHLGLTPKMYQRVIRFNKVLAEIEKNNTIHWTRLCYDLDYHDQAHFIKEFREFAGFNPNKFLKVKGEYINYVPVN